MRFPPEASTAEQPCRDLGTADAAATGNGAAALGAAGGAFDGAPLDDDE